MGLNARINAGYMDLIIRVTRVTNIGWGDAYLRLLKNAPMLGKENCYKYFRISLKLISFTSNNTL